MKKYLIRFNKNIEEIHLQGFYICDFPEIQSFFDMFGSDKGEAILAYLYYDNVCTNNKFVSEFNNILNDVDKKAELLSRFSDFFGNGKGEDIIEYIAQLSHTLERDRIIFAFLYVCYLDIDDLINLSDYMHDCVDYYYTTNDYAEIEGFLDYFSIKELNESETEFLTNTFGNSFGLIPK